MSRATSTLTALNGGGLVPARVVRHSAGV